MAAAKAPMERMILQSRLEQGCEEYAYAEDVLTAGLIHVKEMWQSGADLDRHFASEHIAAWRATWPESGISDRSLRLYEVGEPNSI